jgi:TonB family protein
MRNGLAILMTLLAGAELAAAQSTPEFPPPLSPGEAIKAATEAAAATRANTGPFDILSDTQGVDFGPYVERILKTVRENWYPRIPLSAEERKGKLAIEFAITKDGQVAGMRLVASSGDVALDRPAWDSIRDSNPFPSLPSEFIRTISRPSRSLLLQSGEH